MTKGKNDPFVNPNSRIREAQKQQEGNPHRYGCADHGMLDSVIAKSETGRKQGKRVELAERAKTSLDNHEPPILGFPGVGPNNVERLHPDRWHVSKHALDTDPMGTKRPAHVDLPKVLERNAAAWPQRWEKSPTGALIFNKKDLIEKLVPADRVHHAKPFQPLPLSNRAVPPTIPVLGFPGMGMHAELPRTGLRHVPAEYAKPRPAPHLEVEMRYRRSQSVAL
jgi:hypothetical protein